MDTHLRTDIHDIVRGKRQDILDLLLEMVECNSFSHNQRGVNHMGEIVAREMPAGFSHEVVSQDTLGDHHIFSQVKKGGLAVILAGHLDTLCPEDEGFCSLYNHGDRLLGPGVNDMKSGNLVLIWSLRVLAELGVLSDIPVVCIFNGDEELGSPTSHALFSGMKGKVALALVFECGGPDGTVVTTRKGINRYRLRITGEANHFGNLKGAKISAVEEAAHQALALEALNSTEAGLAVNVGRIEGGLAANACAEHATLDFEYRYWQTEVGKQAAKRVDTITSTTHVPGCCLDREALSHRPPMLATPESMRLFEMIVSLGAELGQPIIEEKRGGVSDACWLAHAGIPTIDGLGPLGDLDFTPREYILRESLFQRIELVSELLVAIRAAGLVG